MEKEPEETPEIHEISRMSIPVQEEFIAPEARPSRDEHDLPCSRCGKPRENWDGPGVERDGEVFCCEECAEKKG